jgi:Protein of unknown function (DUF2909)
MKILIAVVLVAIIAALALAGRAMLGRGQNEGDKKGRMARALTLRVALSIGLFAFIWFSHYMGWIHPTGIPMGSR